MVVGGDSVTCSGLSFHFHLLPSVGTYMPNPPQKRFRKVLVYTMDNWVRHGVARLFRNQDTCTLNTVT